MDKLRVIITTDSEIDDKCSMLRFLLYANDFDIEAIISVNSKWQKDGHGELWIHDFIDMYSKVYDNLLLHDKEYPTPNYLHTKVIQGLVDRAPIYASAPPYNDQYSTDYIINILLDNDPRPVYISMWGGGTLMANVMWKIQTQYSKEDFEKAVSKVRMYFIDYQEFGTGGGQWLRDNIPQAQNILDYQFCETYNYKPRHSQPYEALMGDDWLIENVTKNHGPLGSSYYTMRNGLYVSEGDTPSYLWYVNNGLRSHESPDFGGWGGRHTNIGDNQWNDGTDDGDDKKPIYRWVPAVQNDWARRLDWCVKSYDETIHPPVVIVNEIDREVKPGEVINLSCEKSYSLDGDKLVCNWWEYHDVSTCSTKIEIQNADTANASFVVPEDKGTIHIICEVNADVDMPMTRYQRIIFTIK